MNSAQKSVKDVCDARFSCTASWPKQVCIFSPLSRMEALAQNSSCAALRKQAGRWPQILLTFYRRVDHVGQRLTC